MSSSWNDFQSFYRLIKKLLIQNQRKNIFLRTNKSLKHPNREIESVLLDDDKTLIEVMINFMGLLGSSSQLPNYMLDKLSRNEDDNAGWTLFFDFFNHYILWLLFDVQKLKNYPSSFQKDFQDSLSKVLFSILGIKNEEIAQDYLPFAPLLLSLRRPKIYIEKVLQSNFNLHNKLSILENIPHQILINHNQINKIGIKNNTLGVNFILGKKFVSYQNKIAIYIKDIEYFKALEYIPIGKNHKKLRDGITFLTNNEFCVDLYLKINYSDKMNFVLGDRSVAKLGWGKILGKNKRNYIAMKIKLCD